MKLEATRAIPIRTIILQMWALNLANHLRMAPPGISQARTFQLQSPHDRMAFCALLLIDVTHKPQQPPVARLTDVFERHRKSVLRP